MVMATNAAAAAAADAAGALLFLVIVTVLYDEPECVPGLVKELEGQSEAFLAYVNISRSGCA